MDYLAMVRAEARDAYSWSNGPGDRYAEHRHPFNKLLYCTEGSIDFRLGDGRVIALAAGDEPPMKELLAALGIAKSLDFARVQTLAQEFFGSRDAAAANFELLARLLEEILCCKLLGTDFAAFPPKAAGTMAQLADRIGVDALVKCIDAAVRASAAIEEMANPRLQAENWWTIAGQAMRDS